MQRIEINLTENSHRGENMLLSFNLDLQFVGVAYQTELSLRYIADRDIVTDNHFHLWVIAMSKQKWENAAQIAGEIISQFYDQVLPGYVDVSLTYTTEDSVKHRAFLAKQQPNFKIPELIAPALK